MIVTAGPSVKTALPAAELADRKGAFAGLL